MNIPVLPNYTKVKKPVVNANKSHSYDGWTFSFKYFKQIDYFGLASENPNWFISLLDRLKDICLHKPEDFNTNHQVKSTYRYHQINWSATNIPIRRSDIDWIDKDIILNEIDFPFYQFQLSKGKGRIVGFWDSKQLVFQIVLLDPKHNLQPAGGRYSYRVDKTSILPCQYTSILTEIDRLKSIKCISEKCLVKEELSNIQDKMNVGNYVYFQLDDAYYKEFREKTKQMSIKDMAELFILSS